jgi:tape measure domain-containing protein
MAADRSMSVRLSLIVGDFIQNARRAGQSVNGIAASAAQPITTMQALTGVSRDLGQTLTATAGIGTAALASWGASAFATGAAYNVLQQTAGSALETLMGSAEAAAAQMEELTEFARSSPFPRQMWIQAQQQLIGFGVEAEKIVPIFSALQDGVVAVGGSAQSIEEVVQILAKMSSVGKVTAEDLNELGVRGINAAGLVGEAWGMTAAEVRDSISSGTVDATQFLDALMGQMQTNYAGAAEGLRETWVGAFDRIKGATRDVGSILAAPFIDPAGGGAAVEWANEVADALRAFESALGPAVDFLEGRADPAFDAVTESIQSLEAALGNVDLVQLLDNLSDGGAALAGFGAAALAAGSASALSAVGMGGLAGAVSPLTIGLIAAAAASPELRDALIDLVVTAAPLLPVLADLVVQVAAVGSSGISAAGSLLSALMPAVTLILNVVQPAAEFVGVLASMISEIPTPALAAAATIVAVSLAVKALAVQVKTFGVLSLAASLVGLADAAGKAKFAIAGLVTGAVLLGINALLDGVDDTVEKLEEINSIDVSGLAKDLQFLTESGEMTAGLEQMFGSGADAADQFNRSLMIATAAWYDWENGLNVTIAENEAAETSFRNLDAAMAQLVASGHDADTLLADLADAYNVEGQELEALLQLMPQYRAEAERQEAGIQGAVGATEELTSAQDGLAESTDRARLSLKELADEIRARTDPTFAAIKATRDLEEAERSYQDAVSEHGATSDEAREAMLAYLEAQFEAASAAGELAEVTSSLPPEMIAMAEAMGISTEGIAWLQEQFENAQASGEEFSSTVQNMNADITTSSGRMQVENALIYSGMAESQARGIVQMKAKVDELIAAGYSYTEAMDIVAEQSNIPMGIIQDQFKQARAAGLEFSDEYPAEVSLSGDDEVIQRAKAVQRWMESIQRTVTISFNYTANGDWRAFLPRGGASIPYSTGGPVGGPLGAGDVVPAVLTPGEHVWTRAEVDAAGGHDAMQALRSAVLAGQTRFAQSSSVGMSYSAPTSRPGWTVNNLNIEAINERLDMRQVSNELNSIGAV